MLLRPLRSAKCLINAGRQRVNMRLVSTQPFKGELRPTSATESSTDPKSYETILREMEGRSAQWDEPKSQSRINFLNRPCSVDELYKPLDLGDVVLLNLDPVVIISTPDVPDGPYIVADAVGRAKEVFRNMVDARLMSLVSAHRIRELEGRLFTLDSAAADPALEIGVEPSVTSSAPTSKVVSRAVHKLVALPLRRLYNSAMKRAQQLLPKVVSALDSRQHMTHATTSSFVDLVLEVCPSSAPQYCVTDLYAVRLCLDHYTLVHKHILDFSYSGRYALTVLPCEDERRNLEVIYGGKENPGFLTDYACENIPGAEGESRAIEILRREFPKVDHIDSATASELLELPLGGVSRKLRYSWFTEARHDFVAPQTPDKMHGLREDFNVPVYCIDSADALEIDDGISMQRINAHYIRLGVHIADPSAFTKTLPLVKQVLKRPTTVYELNGAAIPMLPRSLTHELDLVSGQRRPALTLFVDLNLVTMQFDNVELKPMMLNQVVNLTPEEVENSRAEFAEFSRVADALRAHRLANGAFELQSSAEQSFASRIVSEFMIMANHLVSVYCHKHKIPLLYRSQRVLTQSESLRKHYKTTLIEDNGRLGFKWRPVIQKSLVSVTPRPHTGIGYNPTTRFTSPLRRLEDYITHCQIEAHLRGDEAPFTENDLARMVPWLQASQELVREYQQQLVLHDTLTRLQLSETLEGVVSQVPWDRSPASVTTPRTRVFLPKYGIEADYVGSAQLNVEEARTFIIKSVSIHAGSATVVLSSEPDNQ